MASIIAMPFSAMKMDSSFPYSRKTTARMIKNVRLTQTICTMLRNNTTWKRILGRSLVSLFSAICQGDNNSYTEAHASAIMAVPKSLDIPMSCSFSSKTMSIISISSKRSMAIRKDNLDTSSLCLSVLSESSAVFSNSSSRRGVSNTQYHLQNVWTKEFSLVDAVSDYSKYDGDVDYQSDDIQTSNAKQMANLQGRKR